MAVDMYLKVDGVDGESADSKHKGWIDILSYTWGSQQMGAMATGGGGGAGKVSYTDLHIVSHLDKATPALMKMNSAGQHIANVKVSVCKAGGSEKTPQIEYCTIVLKDVIITSVILSGTGGNEQIGVDYTFQAAVVELHYWVQQANGERGAESQMGWDVKANKATM